MALMMSFGVRGIGLEPGFEFGLRVCQVPVAFFFYCTEGSSRVREKELIGREGGRKGLE